MSRAKGLPKGLAKGLPNGRSPGMPLASTLDACTLRDAMASSPRMRQGQGMAALSHRVPRHWMQVTM